MLRKGAWLLHLIGYKAPHTVRNSTAVAYEAVKMVKKIDAGRSSFTNPPVFAHSQVSEHNLRLGISGEPTR